MQNPLPAFSNSLTALSKILAKAEAHCEAHKIDPEAILKARLFPNMLNLIRNVLIACDTAKGVGPRLSGTDNPSFPDEEASFADLQARIQKTQDFLATFSDEAFDGAEEREVVMKFGPQEMKFSGKDYLWTFALPNFYFHMTTTYALLRHNGVDVGKRDFLNG